MFFRPNARRHARTLQAFAELALSLAEQADANALAASAMAEAGAIKHGYLLVGESKAYASAARKVLNLTKDLV